MSKFKALSTFQSWPKDWQKLCVEYWSECSGVGVGKPASVRPRRSSTAAWSEEEHEALLKCLGDYVARVDGIQAFLALYPGRSFSAVAQRVNGIKNGRYPSKYNIGDV